MASPAQRRASVDILRAWGPTALLIAVLTLAVAVVVVGLRSTPPSPARPLILASGPWAPYIDPEEPGGGPVTELVTSVFQQAGYQAEVRYMSWSVVEDSIDGGGSTAAFPLVLSDQRSEKYLTSEPLVDFEYVLFYNKGSGEPRIESADDLGALRIGGVAGYDYWPEIDAAVDEWAEYPTTLAGFEALHAGEIDVLAEGRITGQAVMTSSEFSGDASAFDFVRGDSPLVRSVQGLHLMVTRSDEAEELMTTFDEALSEFRRTEEYHEIVGDLDERSLASVQLEPWSTAGLIDLLDAGGDRILLAPRGTEATVLEWPEELTSAARPGDGAPLVKVKITSGPATGRIAFVDARAVTVGGLGS